MLWFGLVFLAEKGTFVGVTGFGFGFELDEEEEEANRVVVKRVWENFGFCFAGFCFTMGAMAEHPQ
jgi:hypothetical protein